MKVGYKVWREPKRVMGVEMKRGLYERVFFLIVLFEAETCGVRPVEIIRINIFQMLFLSSKAGGREWIVSIMKLYESNRGE